MKWPKGWRPGRLYRGGSLVKRQWFEWTREFRPPKKGEFYLSGAVATVYEVLNDLSDPYFIMRKVEPPPRTINLNGIIYRRDP